MHKPDRTKRADRRIAKARMKHRARKVYPHDPTGASADHLAMCSCPACGNPRRHWKSPTLQELRAPTAELV